MLGLFPESIISGFATKHNAADTFVVFRRTDWMAATGGNNFGE
jgi:hypothetical protein